MQQHPAETLQVLLARLDSEHQAISRAQTQRSFARCLNIGTTIVQNCKATRGRYFQALLEEQILPSKVRAIGLYTEPSRSSEQRGRDCQRRLGGPSTDL